MVTFHPSGVPHGPHPKTLEHALEPGKAGTDEVAVMLDIWNNHRADLEASDDLFFSWQYDMRWAADHLRREGKLMPKPKGDRGPWRLAN